MGSSCQASSAGDFVDSFCQALDIVGRNSGNRYAAIFGSVDRVLVGVSKTK